MNGIALLLNLDMAVMLVLAVVVIVAMSSNKWYVRLYPEVAAKMLMVAAFLALVLVSLHKFLRMEG